MPRKEVITPAPLRCDARLIPSADDAGTLRWLITGAHPEGEPLPPQITVTVLATGPDVLWCRADDRPRLILAADTTLWPRTATLAGLPARGRLSVRPILVTTRMGRIIRYLIPEFTAD